MDNKNYISLDFNDIDVEVLKTANLGILKINKEGVNFYINTHFKYSCDKLVVFSNGAIDRSKKNLQFS